MRPYSVLEQTMLNVFVLVPDRQASCRATGTRHWAAYMLGLDALTALEAGGRDRGQAGVQVVVFPASIHTVFPPRMLRVRRAPLDKDAAMR